MVSKTLFLSTSHTILKGYLIHLHAMSKLLRINLCFKFCDF
ncbi:hypothetical protein HPNQ4161_0965 [Helicobacter pylori NQ4161]|nr:hypothetical protein HPNQ4161_0965 [Helicobacter pylori NQ4161]